jgi:hypothetical protein
MENNMEEIKSELPPTPCIKCGYPLDSNGVCTNPGCHYSGRKQI